MSFYIFSLGSSMGVSYSSIGFSFVSDKLLIKSLSFLLSESCRFCLSRRTHMIFTLFTFSYWGYTSLSFLWMCSFPLFSIQLDFFTLITLTLEFCAQPLRHVWLMYEQIAELEKYVEYRAIKNLIGSNGFTSDYRS